MKAAKKWYSELLGIEPYFERPDFEQPAYIEFRLGDYQHELSIIDSKYAPKSAAAGPGGSGVYWHVDDVAATLEKVTAMKRTLLRRTALEVALQAITDIQKSTESTQPTR